MSEEAIAVPRVRLLSPGFTALLLANVCFGYAFSSFFLLPKFMVVALAAGPADVGLIAAVHGAVVVLTLPLAGVAVDRLGRCGFLTAGALVMAAASFAYPLVGEVGPLLYGLRAVQALAFAMVFAAGGALAVDLAPPERLGQAIGIYGLSFLSMNAVAPACVEHVASSWSWDAAFAAAGLGAVASALLSLRVREPARPDDGGGNGDGLLALAVRASQLRMLLVIALVGCAMSAVFAFHQLFALELGMQRVSDFFVAYSVAALTVRGGFGHLMDQWGLRRVSLAALALYACVVWATSQLGSIGLVPLGLGLGVAHGIFYPAFNAVAVSTARAAERGRVMALFQAAFQTGMATGGLGLGQLAERVGYAPVFQVAAAGLAVALLVLVASPEGRVARFGDAG